MQALVVHEMLAFELNSPWRREKEREKTKIIFLYFTCTSYDVSAMISVEEYMYCGFICRERPLQLALDV